MCFLLEEASWAWDGADRTGYVERIEQFLDRLDTARERDEPYWASSELLAQEILGPEETLADLLWNPGVGLALPHEINERIVALFNNMPYWDETQEWVGIEVVIDGRPVLSPSAALAQERVRQGERAACLPLPGTWSVGGGISEIHYGRGTRSTRRLRCGGARRSRRRDRDPPAAVAAFSR